MRRRGRNHGHGDTWGTVRGGPTLPGGVGVLRPSCDSATDGAAAARRGRLPAKTVRLGGSGHGGSAKERRTWAGQWRRPRRFDPEARTAGYTRQQSGQDTHDRCATTVPVQPGVLQGDGQATTIVAPSRRDETASQPNAVASPTNWAREVRRRRPGPPQGDLGHRSSTLTQWFAPPPPRRLPGWYGEQKEQAEGRGDCRAGPAGRAGRRRGSCRPRPGAGRARPARPHPRRPRSVRDHARRRTGGAGAPHSTSAVWGAPRPPRAAPAGAQPCRPPR